MQIKNRLFPYPVLCGDTDDYLNSTEFILEPKIEDKIHELIFSFEYHIKCNSLEKLLREGSAEYVLHIECSTTAFRIAIRSETPYIEYRLPKSRVNGEVNLVAMIIAKKEIIKYSSNELNEDYAGLSFDLRKGQILAYQNLPSLFVHKKTEELANNESFFTVVKQVSLDPDEQRPLTFSLASNKIQIFVDEKTYEAFLHFQGTKSIALALLVMPALTYMINEVYNNPDVYKHYEWYQRLNKYYVLNGKEFIEDVIKSDDNPIAIAQEMLKNPISIAYRDLLIIGG